jgi:SAM-dependent methyltransferase
MGPRSLRQPSGAASPRPKGAFANTRWMVRFSDYDTRGYRMVDARTGYREWVSTYEQTVEDAMDVALVEELEQPDWQGVRRAADLGCGTGRTAAWLRRHGVAAIDGVDISPEMLAVAHARGLHDRLVEAEVTHTGLEPGAYDLVIACLVDEHLEDLNPLYREALRLAAPGGLFILVGFHPHFIIASGMPTHFTDAAGEHVAIATHVHLVSDQVTAGLGAGWTLVEMREAVVDERWLELKPTWERFRNHPVSAAFVWRRPA